MELDPATGKVINTFHTGRSPIGIVSDGERLWVSNSSSDSLSFHPLPRKPELDRAGGP